MNTLGAGKTDGGRAERLIDNATVREAKPAAPIPRFVTPKEMAFRCFIAHTLAVVANTPEWKKGQND
jgi:hypothetical protein